MINAATEVIFYRGSNKPDYDDEIDAKALSEYESEIVEDLVLKDIVFITKCSQLNSGLYVRRHRVS